MKFLRTQKLAAWDCAILIGRLKTERIIRLLLGPLQIGCPTHRPMLLRDWTVNQAFPNSDLASATNSVRDCLWAIWLQLQCKANNMYLPDRIVERIASQDKTCEHFTHSVLFKCCFDLWDYSFCILLKENRRVLFHVSEFIKPSQGCPCLSDI